ncbi:Carbohydrate binding module (family 6) [compost metagenome]
MAYYNINFPTSGNYVIEYRVASAVNGARLSSDLNAGTIQLGAVNVPNTGGWQNWQTITQTVNVNAGTYKIGFWFSC